jgi:hypothetical protein
MFFNSTMQQFGGDPERSDVDQNSGKADAQDPVSEVKVI